MTSRSRCGCGALLATGVQWCSQCYEPVAGPASPVPSGEKSSQYPQGERPGAPTGPWNATVLTYGLPARMLGTVLASLPLLVLLVIMVKFRILVVLALVAAYTVVYRPVMRSIWRRSDRL